MPSAETLSHSKDVQPSQPSRPSRPSRPSITISSTQKSQMLHMINIQHFFLVTKFIRVNVTEKVLV
jgi:hypothetical protein